MPKIQLKMLPYAPHNMVNCNKEGGILGGPKQMEKHLNDSLQSHRFDSGQSSHSQASPMRVLQGLPNAGHIGEQWQAGSQQLALLALPDCQTFPWFFHSTRNKTHWKGKATLWGRFSPRARWHLRAVEQPVIKYHGVKDLADSMSIDLMHLRLHHGGSLSSGVPEVHSFVPQDKSAGQNKQGSCSMQPLLCQAQPSAN